MEAGSIFFISACTVELLSLVGAPSHAGVSKQRAASPVGDYIAVK